jgi:hypothetical protein
MSALIETVRDQVEAEREACIRILEDLRPRNDRSDWTEYAYTTDNALLRAINQINARYYL